MPEAERQQNLDAFKFIGREAARRGLDFQLGLWNEGYDFDDSPNASHRVVGVTKQNLRGYCRDSVAFLLREIPEITGLSFRIHVECGVAEGDYDFWRTVFSAVKTAGRTIEINLHAKGLDEHVLGAARDTGMPLVVAPKYLAEHMGLPYHPSAIRDREYPPAEAVTGREQLSTGSRRFTRQSYGDYLPPVRDWGVMFRIWPGTQRVLSWGDPAFAAAYGRSMSFCDADGMEWMEPMTFKGRQGSGIAGGRSAIADQTMATHPDWRRHEYAFRLLGPADLFARDRPRKLAPLSRRQTGRRGPLMRSRTWRGEPHPAARHPDPRALDRQQLLLARDLHQHIRHRHLSAAAGRLRHGWAHALRQRPVLRPADVSDGEGLHRDVAGGRRSTLVHAARRGGLARWLCRGSRGRRGRTRTGAGVVEPAGRWLCRGHRDHGRDWPVLCAEIPQRLLRRIAARDTIAGGAASSRSPTRASPSAPGPARRMQATEPITTISPSARAGICGAPGRRVSPRSRRKQTISRCFRCRTPLLRLIRLPMRTASSPCFAIASRWHGSTRRSMPRTRSHRESP